MESKNNNIELLTDYLESNKVVFSIDENPSPSKLQRITDAIRKKEALIGTSVQTYQLSVD